ncbi:hypothetical protein ACTU3I_05340 [Microbacterium sp. RD1]|uniref:hypothetical protein n=1 Tax=Microbacterium sp. RD1 TaxID=3457313 RepID=UPI003FA5D9D2
MTASSATRLGAGRYAEIGEVDIAHAVAASVHELQTADGARVTGVLRTPAGARAVVAIMHPRQDVTHHPLVPLLLSQGYAVWTQGSRSPNNDLTLLHEQAIIDLAAGQVFLREAGFASVVLLGHSGGGTLSAFYTSQAARTPAGRLTATPSGRPVALAEVPMPLPDGIVFLAPHPGQGALLQRVIDPSVMDEADPLSVDPDLDPFDPRNGFAEPGISSAYPAEFIERYRSAQIARVRRIDAAAKRFVDEADAARTAFAAHESAADRRRALVPRVILVPRTDADLRNVDLSLDPNDRPYGSLFGRRPDLTNYGLVGFGRLSTPEAWLSTWSATTTNADFLRCAPDVTVPSLLLEFTGDQASFPGDIQAMATALGSEDLMVDAVEGTHFGGPLHRGGVPGAVLASERMRTWLGDRFTP